MSLLKQTIFLSFKYLSTFLFFLICFIFLANKPAMAAISSAIPMPEVNKIYLNQLTLVRGEQITGQSLNFSQIRVFINHNFYSLAATELGTNGWQTFSIATADLIAGEYNLTLITDYFRGLESEPLNLKLVVQEKVVGPTLFNPVLNQETNFKQPWLIGVTPAKTEVEFCLDDKIIGRVLTTDNVNGTSAFRYQPPALTLGYHVVKARAYHQNGLVSSWSNEIIFAVVENKKLVKKDLNLKTEKEKFIPPVPAPTLFEPATGVVTNQTKPTIKGLVHNNHWVKIYLDNKIAGEFMPTPHASGVTSFSWMSNKDLLPGLHTVYSRAINPQGQESGDSMTLRWLILPEAPIFISELKGQVSSASIVAENIEDNPEIKVIEDNQGFFSQTKKWSFWLYIFIGLVIFFIITIIVWQRRIFKHEQAEVQKEGNKEPDDPVAGLKEEVEQRKQD
ncbi:MAG TPA: hypothetical protein PKZ16_00545 [bacterium]|nr:hypothetical protein [bacterium]HPL95722.1 hypothetical protein [bacterium]